MGHAARKDQSQNLDLNVGAGKAAEGIVASEQLNTGAPSLAEKLRDGLGGGGRSLGKVGTEGGRGEIEIQRRRPHRPQQGQQGQQRDRRYDDSRRENYSVRQREGGSPELGSLTLKPGLRFGAQDDRLPIKCHLIPGSKGGLFLIKDHKSGATTELDIVRGTYRTAGGQEKLIPDYKFGTNFGTQQKPGNCELYTVEVGDKTFSFRVLHATNPKPFGENNIRTPGEVWVIKASNSHEVVGMDGRVVRGDNITSRLARCYKVADYSGAGQGTCYNSTLRTTKDSIATRL